MFTYRTTVRLPQTDAAGVMFFGEYFTVAHDAYQGFMRHIGLPLVSFLNEHDFLPLIVHAECDYKQAVFTDDELVVAVSVARLGRGSFELSYVIGREDQQPVAMVRTVHATVDKSTHQPISLPEMLRRGLREHQED